MQEEEMKELFKEANLVQKNEDLNNFYQDNLQNANEIVWTVVAHGIRDILIKNQNKSNLDQEWDW